MNPDDKNPQLLKTLEILLAFAGQTQGAAIESLAALINCSIDEAHARIEVLKACGLAEDDPQFSGRSPPPPLGDRYWYPLYEKLCELDIPAHIHATGSHSERSPYTLHFINEETIAIYGLINSSVFKDFPDLKIICSHGGGAIPYQNGCFQSGSNRKGINFLDGMRNIYYDTVLYSEEALRLLIKTVGVDRCVFGAECPGVGSTLNPDTGRTFDQIKPFIENFDWLSSEDKTAIFEGNATRLFKLDQPTQNSI